LGDQFLYEHEHLIMGLTFALYKASRADRTMNDRDLIAGLSALARSYERLVNTGLHYDESTHGAASLAVMGELQTMVKEYREAEQKHTGYSRLRDSDVLKTLVFLVRMAYGRTSGRPKSRAFVDFLTSQFPEKQSALASPQEAGSRIIVP
jgi:hypothetical protein